MSLNLSASEPFATQISSASPAAAKRDICDDAPPDAQTQEAILTKTYLTIYCSSEGAPPSVVVERLTRMGFRPIAGPYDFEYEWEENGEVEEMIQIANRVHATLKGCKVFFKLETVSTR